MKFLKGISEPKAKRDKNWQINLSSIKMRTANRNYRKSLKTQFLLNNDTYIHLYIYKVIINSLLTKIIQKYKNLSKLSDLREFFKNSKRARPFLLTTMCGSCLSAPSPYKIIRGPTPLFLRLCIYIFSSAGTNKH